MEGLLGSGSWLYIIFIGFILNTMTAEEAVCHRIMGICTFKTLPCRRDIILCPVILHFPTPSGHFSYFFSFTMIFLLSASTS